MREARGRGREGNKGDWEGEREGIGKEREGRGEEWVRRGEGKKWEGRKKGKGRGNGEGRENTIVAKYTPKHTKLHHFFNNFPPSKTPLF